jgi:uncharacterized repeat protein (TIGR01451 family)
MRKGLLFGLLLFGCGLAYSSQPLVDLSSSPTSMNEGSSWQNTIQTNNFSATKNSDPGPTSILATNFAISKTVSNANPNVGDTITFTITLTNSGSDNATGVEVIDLLPAGLTFVSATPSQGTYNSATGLWTVGAVASGGGTQTLLIQATVVSPNMQTNTAIVTTSIPLDPGLPKQASVTITPQQADLAISKTVNNATPNVGDTITFTVTLANLGPNTATNVRVTDLLPAGLTFVNAIPSQGTYNSGTGLWTVGTVTTGAPQTLIILATVVSSSAQTNTSTITHSDQFDPNTANNSASATITSQQADLAISKTVSNATPNVGDTITFTVTLANLGPNTATNVQVTDLLPVGLTFVSATPSQGTYNSGTGLWTVGTVTTGAPQTLIILATVVSPSAQTNTSTITHSDQFDPNTANNSASVSININSAPIINGSPAITLYKSANVTHFSTPNTLIVYSYLVTNSGNVTLTNLTITDSQLGLSAIICPSTTLAPGGQETCTATYLTTFADIQLGQITTLATVIALSSNGLSVQAQSSVTVQLDKEFIRKKTMVAINNFLSTRAQLVLSDEPDKRRIINRLSSRTQSCSGRPQGGFQPGNDRIALNGYFSLSELCMPMNKWDIWSEIHGSYYEQNQREVNRHGAFGITYLGIDYLLNSSVVFGVLGEGDLINQNGSVPGAIKANGQGWMVGPYLSSRLMPDLYLHTRAAWGGSDNKINVFNLYDDSFNTMRSLYNADLVGDLYYAPWRISPTLGISYYSELQREFINYLAVGIPNQRINLGQIHAGPEFAYLIVMNNKEITWRLSLQGLYNFGYHENNDFNDGLAPMNRFSGRVKLGAEFRSASGFSITPMINYNGSASRFYNSIDGQIQVSVPFN